MRGMEVVQEMVRRQRSAQIAQQREAYTRRVLEARLPRRLHWLIDHPRLLRLVLRLVRRWRPTLSVVPLRVSATAESAVAMSERWITEMEARGRDIEGGYVFTYTDVNQLPAEVYGPVAASSTGADVTRVTLSDPPPPGYRRSDELTGWPIDPRTGEDAARAGEMNAIRLIGRGAGTAFANLRDVLILIASPPVPGRLARWSPSFILGSP